MKHISALLFSARAAAFVLACRGGLAQAQTPTHGSTVLYNEAVRMVDGKRLVELPPPIFGYPDRTKPPKIAPYQATQYLIEHERGLLQCTYSMYDAASCEPADVGRVKRYRTWVVKLGGQWQGCRGNPNPTECVALRPKLDPNKAASFFQPLPGEVF